VTTKLTGSFVVLPEKVGRTANQGHVIFLKLFSSDLVIPVFVGDFECTALIKEINKRTTARPMTHDLMKNSLQALSVTVARVKVTKLVDNTYYASIFYLKTDQQQEIEVEVDARPSDAINMAVRFGAPIFVNQKIVDVSAYSLRAEAGPQVANEASAPAVAFDIAKAIQAAGQRHLDPTTHLRAHLAVAVQEERYEDASRLRDEIDRVIATDRFHSLIVAIEKALEDRRYDEAAQLHEELIQLEASEDAGDLSVENNHRKQDA